jgi:hypothetical protein
MSLKKYASLEQARVLDLKGSDRRERTASLDKIGEFRDYRTEDGYLYARIRAISSRVNKNHDGWPSVELAGGEDIFNKHAKLASSENFTVTAAEGDAKYGFATFLGKPIFVDHNNSNPARARGVIVDSKLHVEDHKTASELDPYYADAPDNHTPPTWVELLLEVDAKSFPKLAKAIVEGSKNPKKGIDGFSMGCDVERSVCSICKNAATSPDEYCNHVKLKGAHFDAIDKHGRKTSKKSYEDCYGIKFFEISAVFDPADETALTREVMASVRKEGEHDLPQSEMMTMPEEVDTMRKEEVCPVCGSSMEAEHQCDVCGYVPPPEGLDNPDLDAAKAQDPDPQAFLNDPAPTELGQANPGSSQPVQDPMNMQPVARVTNDMAWQIYHPKLGGVINPGERPIKADSKPATNEPVETIISDQTKPVTNRTAASMIAAVNKETNMSNRVAADAPAGTKEDKRVDVTGVGGVMDASNEEASKPTGAHSWEEAGTTTDVTGKGGIIEDSNEEASKPSAGTESVEKVVRTDDSGPTKTFENSNEPNSAVTDKAFTTYEAAKQGVKPNGGADVQPQRRENVEQESGFSNPQDGTDQWTGTGGNGVTKQQDPVTKKVDPNIDVAKMTSVVELFKIADQEVELGLIPVEEKYDRIAELENASPEEIQATAKVLARVKTAGLSRRTAATAPGGIGRVPSMRPTARTAHVELDDQLFT